jgi:lipopolysaccharide export system protein LptA
MTLFFSSNVSRAVAALVAVAVTSGVAVVHAQQQPSGPPNALQGFSQNRDKPIKINAESLEVRDKDKMATFSGDVRLLQGDVRMNSSTLVVFYDDQPPPAQPAPAPSKGGNAPAASAPAQIPPQQQQNQQIKRVEAKGSVTVRVPKNDQTATGDQGIFDMRGNTVTMQGNVVISQGLSVLRGDRLVVNMNTGDSALTCDKGGCTRVQGVFSSSQPATKDSSSAAAPARNAPMQTTRRSASP